MHYRDLYAQVMRWSQQWLFDSANPEPLRWLAQRGLTAADAQHCQLGYSLRDSRILPIHLQASVPHLLPYACAAGVLRHDEDGVLHTHGNLCGAVLFPVRVGDLVTDIRARRPSNSAKTRSLPGAYQARGAVYPTGWDAIPQQATIVLTESGEFKTLLPLLAYERGELPYPTIGLPGLTQLNTHLIKQLVQQQVQEVILAYDGRPIEHTTQTSLSHEEYWSIRHGLLLARALGRVRVVLFPCIGCHKHDLDSFVLQYGSVALAKLLNDAVPLEMYIARFPRGVLRQHCWPTL